ncbi:MAG TPA: HAD hydrolase family protein [Clostridiales bacterium]|nr:HAD hydrolase family protein [Clostridiales bacterium]
MKKLLASDYDNTLKNQGVVSKEDMKAIEKWRENGNLFVVVTGRFEKPEELLIPIDACICCSGNKVVLDDRNEYVYFGSNAELAGLAKECVKHESTDNVFNICTPNGNFRFGFADLVKNDFSQLGDIPEFLQVSLLFDNDVDCEKVCESIRENVDGLNVLQNGRCVDVLPQKMNKAVGIRDFADKRGIEEKNIITVGDAMNDYDMLKSYNGYVIEHGHPELIRAIGQTTKSVARLISVYNKK